MPKLQKGIWSGLADSNPGSDAQLCHPCLLAGYSNRAEVVSKTPGAMAEACPWHPLPDLQHQPHSQGEVLMLSLLPQMG